MTYAPLLLSLLAVDLLAAMSPGPNFVLVSQSAIHRSRRYALAIVCGLVLSNLLWCAAVMLGLATLFQLVPWLYGTIKILGGTYLVYLGVQLWRADQQPGPAKVSLEKSSTTGFMRGMLTNLGNPKAAVYFGSVFALFLKPGTPEWVQLVAVAIVVADTVLWYGAVAVLLSTHMVQRLYRDVRRPIDRVAGALLIAFGVRLVFSRS